MLFGVGSDDGREITGYLAPDDATATSMVALLVDGAERWRGPASEIIPSLVAAGRHRTGRCGFRIGPDEAPGLEHEMAVEVRCAETGVAIYRRAVLEGRLARRVLRLETAMAPMAAVDAALAPLFLLRHLNVERLGRETAMQTLQLMSAPSQYVSGRLAFPAYEQHVGDAFGVIVALRDPYEELAERLAILRAAAHGRTALLDARERMIHGAAIAAFAEVDLTDPAALARAFRRLDRAAAVELSNPLTRQLTCATAGELCSSDAASTALRRLAGFEVVALRDAAGHFEHAVADYLGVPAPSAGSDPDAGARLALAEKLTAVRQVEALLEFDLEVYDSVATAVERVGA